MPAKTMYEKIWKSHLVAEEPGKPALIYIDRHLVHEGDVPASLLRLESRGAQGAAARPYLCGDGPLRAHQGRDLPLLDKVAATQIEALESNCRETGIMLFNMQNPNQGIIHVIGPDSDHPTGPDDCVRRQPHGHPWSLRGAGFRHRHQRN